MDDAQLHDLQERTPELAALLAEASAAAAAAAEPDALEQVRVQLSGPQEQAHRDPAFDLLPAGGRETGGR